MLDLLVSIVGGPALVGHEMKTTSQASVDADGRSSLSRRVEVAWAVSQAFDEILLKLARELKASMTHGARRRIATGKRHALAISSSSASISSSLFTQMAMARTAGAGLYLDAYEAVVSGLLKTISHPAEGTSGESDRHPMRDGSNTNSSQGSSSNREKTGTRDKQGVSSGLRDIETLKSSWITQKLEVLGE